MRPPLPNPFREAWAGQLRSRQAGEVLQVAGFVHRRRDHGGVVFIDLRDRSGILQLVFHGEAAHRLRSEDVLTARGRLVLREPGNVNPNLATGEVELHVDAFEVLSDAEPPPFPIDEDVEVNEDVRLRHRALDLRRDRMREAIELRHRVTSAIRGHLDAHDFLEIETPLLTRSTPEGARDFLVPSRVRPGAAFALPQSPQLFKQLLMLAGFERYYQIARCFRDEDSRADRLPEFTQLDMELSFVDEEGVMGLVEGLMHRVFEEAGFSGVPAPPYERLPYDEAMLRFGTDRPDRRFGLEITDLSEALAGTDARVFAGALAGGGVVRALNAGARELARSDLDRLVELAREWGAKGLAWAWIEEGGGWRSPIAKFLSEAERATVVQRVRAAPGDVVFFVADRAPVAAEVLGLLRLELGERFGLRGGPHHDVLWIVDFPLFERDPDTGTWDPLHHPFTAPVGDLEGDPGALRSRAYDLVMNGTELGGGSIRINRADVQERVLRLLRIGPEEAQERFGFLLGALRYGAPPHGGIAFGLDRIVALLLGRDSIREVIAFPKTASGLDPLTGAPAPPSREQLRELGITVRAP